MTTIVWFRQDLRLRDNPALTDAARAGDVLPVYILDDTHARPLGGASRWWLHRSLTTLAESLGGLLLKRGDPAESLPALAKHIKADRIVWNRCYDPQSVARDKAIKTDLAKRGIETESFNAALLHEPWALKTGAGEPYKVFTPYWRAARTLKFDAPLRAPKVKLSALPRGDALDDWALTPAKPNWAAGWDKLWTPGETGAANRLRAFLDTRIGDYANGRDRPDADATSRLSPHLHFGEISPRQIYSAVTMAAESGDAPSAQTEKFLSEIGWREFSHQLLFHFPDLPTKNWKPAFDAYPWRRSERDFAAWSRGMTGYPMVDAGMRELWATGYMHNRVRMITASFLIKHLRLDWRRGEAWFWDTLVDADAANNAASWQWVAGSGADASPYFRIFNPIEQGRRHDPEGAYIRRWCPELARLPDKFIHAPFEASADVLRAANITLGKDYPNPIVDHAEARRAALEGYDKVKAAGAA
jgi:deoxyribodipyrimidine photo-lyase